MEPNIGISVDNTTGISTAYGITGTALLGSSSWITSDYSLTNTSLTFRNLNSMHRNQQVKVAVFGVKRTEDGNIQSSKFIKEL